MTSPCPLPRCCYHLPSDQLQKALVQTEAVAAPQARNVHNWVWLSISTSLVPGEQGSAHHRPVAISQMSSSTLTGANVPELTTQIVAVWGA